MTIKDRLMSDLRKAMRGGDELRKATIRMARAAIQSAETDRRTALFQQGVPQEEIADRAALDDAGVQAVLIKAVKQRRESADEYDKAKRPELADRERAEIVILEAYLPTMLGEDEIEVQVATIIAELGATGPSDMSKVMPVAMQRLKGQAEGRTINNAVKKLLAQGGNS